MESMQNPHHSNIRLYLVLTTIVIVAILFLVMTRNGGKALDLTGALINPDGKNGTELSAESSGSATEKISATREIKSIDLHFDKVPKISESTRFDALGLTFSDLSSSGSFKINNNKLELNNVEGEVQLDISNFAGKVVFDDQIFSLSGKAKRIEINHLAFSSDNGIDVSFENIPYQQFSLQQIELGKISLPAGSGSFNSGEKLNYDINNEDVTLYYFSGDLSYGGQNLTELSLNGDVSKVEIDSGTLSWEWS